MVSIKDLKLSSFFKGFNEEYLTKIRALCQEETYRADDFIIKEGEDAKCLYVFLEGTMVIQIHLKEHQDVIVSTVEEEGELFGWSALVEPRCYTASVKCLENSRVLSVPGDKLEMLFKNDPVMGLTFMKKIASLIDRRLCTTRNRLVNCIS
jgi:CRP-like cAMP-binding protein